MEQLKMYYCELAGTHYEIGGQLGELCKQQDYYKKEQFISPGFLSKEEQVKACTLLDEFCPGVNEEIKGFADCIGIREEEALYYSLTYLKPGCSQMVILPKKAANGHVLLARNYEFSEKYEDLIFCTTKVKGKYSHIGNTCALFGRADGMNEYGLGISQSSAGLPVTATGEVRKATIVGLQFWAVIRALLENCKDVDEAMDYLKEMPIAYNINLLLADPKGNAVLFETLDGRTAFKRISETDSIQSLYSTNHVHLEPLKQYEPKGMKNSIIRYDKIKALVEGKQKVDIEAIKKLMSTAYPEGLCCHYYDECFGTLRGIIYDLTAQQIEACFGSTLLNEWHNYQMGQKDNYIEYLANIKRERTKPGDFDMI